MSGLVQTLHDATADALIGEIGSKLTQTLPEFGNP
jgi:hypothetical protein